MGKKVLVCAALVVAVVVPSVAGGGELARGGSRSFSTASERVVADTAPVVDAAAR